MADTRDVKQFNAWYDAITDVLRRVSPASSTATRYELYRVLMFEPQSAPRFLTLYEIEADSIEEARRAAVELTQVDAAGLANAGYIGARADAVRRAQATYGVDNGEPAISCPYFARVECDEKLVQLSEQLAHPNRRSGAGRRSRRLVAVQHRLSRDLCARGADSVSA